MIIRKNTTILSLSFDMINRTFTWIDIMYVSIFEEKTSHIYL